MSEVSIATTSRVAAYRFRLMPSAAVAAQFRRYAGAARYLWNKALAAQQAQHAAGEKWATAFDMNKWLTGWRSAPDSTWLAELPCGMERQALKDLERAYKNFFTKRAAFPRFKRRGERQSFRFPDGCVVDVGNGRIRLPKIGWVRYRNSRWVEGVPKNVTVSFEYGHWYVSIQTERDIPVRVHPATSMVGVDLGIVRFATLSDGTVIAPAAPFAKRQARLARYQRAMARKVKGSANWRKARDKVARLHHKIANIRRDHLHKASTAICRSNAIVCIEELAVKNMSRSAKGTAEAPGRNVKAKSGLNRAIVDQGWGEFRRQLTYKQAWLGGEVIAVPPAYTSQTCPECGHVSSDNRKTQERFACVACGFEENADLVGAINIRAAGDAVLACGGSVQSGRPKKQEPSGESSSPPEPPHKGEADLTDNVRFGNITIPEPPHKGEADLTIVKPAPVETIPEPPHKGEADLTTPPNHAAHPRPEPPHKGEADLTLEPPHNGETDLTFTDITPPQASNGKLIRTTANVSIR